VRFTYILYYVNILYKFISCLTAKHTGCFIIFSVITNIYNKKIKGPTIMELFTATGKLKKFIFLTTIDVRCVHRGDTAHIDTIFKFLPHTHTSKWVLSACTDTQSQ